MSFVSFHVKLLGSFGLYRDDRLVPPAKWGIRTTRELLKHLAARAEQIVSDDVLVDRVWPDADPEGARRSLRVRVSELRKLFSAAGPKADDVIKRAAGGYRFQPVPGVVDVDVVSFSRAARNALRATEAPVGMEYARGARELYGGHFLADDLYDDFWAPKRVRVRQLWQRVSVKLADYLEQEGDYDEAIRVIESILSPSDPQENYYRTLMLLHYKAGRQTEALRVFEQCQVALDTLFGARPMPETIRLMELIVRQGSVDGTGARPGAEDDGKAAAGAIPSDVAPSPGGSPYPFLGRRAEMERLRAAVEGLEGGRGRVLWIAGDSGMGKSRLLAEAFQNGRLGVDKERIVFMRGHGVAHAVPFSTLLDGLQQGTSGGKLWVTSPPVAKNGAEGWPPGLSRGESATANGDTRSGVAAGTPATGMGTDDPEGSTTENPLLQELLGWASRREAAPSLALGVLDSFTLQGTWLRQKLLQLLQQFAAEKPLVLILDNADDVDGATWGVLVALSRFVHRLPILIVAASRRDGEDTDVGRALAEVASDMEHLRLQPLSVGDLVPLVGEGPLTTGVRTWLRFVHKKSDGEPFAMTELLRWMEQSDLVSRGPGGRFHVGIGERGAIDFAIPPPLPLGEPTRRRLDARIAGLTPTARSLLVQGAVLGDSISMPRLQQLSRLEENAFARAFEQLLAIGFIEEFVRGDHVTIQLSHARLQNHVYHQVATNLRRRLHRQIAQLIRRELQADSFPDEMSFPHRRSLLAMEVAYHAEAADEFEQAARWSLVAAEAVTHRVGSMQAVALYRHAAAVAEKLGADDELFREARRGLGLSLCAAYSFGEAIPHLEQYLVRADFSSVTHFDVASQLVLAYMQFQRAEDAQKLADDLLKKTDAFADSDAKGGVMLAMSFLTYRLGDAKTAVKHAKRAIESLRRIGPMGPRLRLAYRWLALYYWDLSRYAEAIHWARRAVTESRRYGDDFELTRSLNTLGEVYQDLFCVDSAQPLHEEALELASRGEYVLLTSELWRNIGMNFLYKNKSDKAFHALERAWQHMVDLDVSPFWKEIALRALIEAYLLAGDGPRVSRLLQEYEGVAGPREAPFVAVFRGALALLEGRLSDFEEMFARTERFWSQTGRRARAHHVWFFTGRMLIKSGAKEAGRGALSRGLADLEKIASELPADLAAQIAASRPVREVRQLLGRR